MLSISTNAAATAFVISRHVLHEPMPMNAARHLFDDLPVLMLLIKTYQFPPTHPLLDLSSIHPIYCDFFPESIRLNPTPKLYVNTPPTLAAINIRTVATTSAPTIHVAGAY